MMMTDTNKNREGAMNIRFDDSQYRAAHGKAPRGYGLWIFSAKTDNQSEEPLVNDYMFTGTLTEAKKDIIWWLRGYNNQYPPYLRVKRAVVIIGS